MDDIYTCKTGNEINVQIAVGQASEISMLEVYFFDSENKNIGKETIRDNVLQSNEKRVYTFELDGSNIDGAAVALEIENTKEKFMCNMSKITKIKPRKILL